MFMKYFRKKMNSAEIKMSYDEVVKTSKAWINGKTKAEQIIILDYVIDVLIEDICSSCAANVLKKPTSSPFTQCIPCFCTDENGNTICIDTGMKTAVDLSCAKLYVCPWEKERTVKNLLDLYNKSFIYDETNHLSNFYTDINLCHVYNGNHSIHIGSYLKKGIIKSNVLQTELLYPNCVTDGLCWYNLHTDKDMGEVTDFRLAAIYSIARTRYEIKCNSE